MSTRSPALIKAQKEYRNQRKQVWISKNLHQQLKEFCKSNNVNMTNVIHKFILNGLSREQLLSKLSKLVIED